MRGSFTPRRTAASDADVLLVGVAIRPCAESARRAGYDVISVDPFGDRDHRRTVSNRSLKRDGPDRPRAAGTEAAGPDHDAPDGGGLAPALVRLSEGVRATEVAYGSSFENHPALVRRLARGGRLLGNPPEVLDAVRNPSRLFGALGEAGFRVPRSSAVGEGPSEAAPTRWLRKPVRGGGGRGVRPWRGEPLPERAYLQEEIPGRPGSILFVAARGRARVLGLTEMLVGWSDFGAPPFAYCGSLLGVSGRGPHPWGSRPARELARRLATFVTEIFRLRGVCGIDVVLDRGTPWPLEVNPRYTAAMELLEETLPIPVFELHRRACEGRLPADGPVSDWAPEGRVRGKAVLRARREARAPDIDRAIRAIPGVRAADLPDRGERVRAGAPLCTLLASADSRCACLHALRRSARRIYAAMSDGR